MSYPYDSRLDPDILSFLQVLRASDDPQDKLAGLISNSMPPDLQAWLHTYGLHGGSVDIGDICFEASSCLPLAHVIDGMDPESVEAAARVGVDDLDLDAAIVMGNTADGDTYYAAAWAPDDTGLTMVKVCLAGYADDGFVALGPLMQSLRDIAANVDDPDDIDEEVRDLLTES